MNTTDLFHRRLSGYLLVAIIATLPSVIEMTKQWHNTIIHLSILIFAILLYIEIKYKDRIKKSKLRQNIIIFAVDIYSMIKLFYLMRMS